MELVTGALGSLLPKLGELLKHEYGLQKGVRKKIESLARELRMVHAVLRKIGDVPREQLDDLVRLWVCDIREASYDMEDIVDAFLVRVDLSPEPATDTNLLGRLLKKAGRLMENMKDRRKISSLIDEISKKLEEVAARRGRYTPDNIGANNPVASTTIDPRILNLYKSATELVGTEGPKDELIHMLSLGDDGGDNKKMKVVSVVGFGGLGKTTLAKAVYNQLKAHFKWRAFIPVGRNPDIKKVLRDILIGLDKEKFMNFMNLNMLDEKQLMDELTEFVKEKRCFIVVDDIWDEDSWKLIRCAMQGRNYASRFIITTRISKVAAHADEVYKMQPLSRDNSKKLLFARISDSEGKYLGCPSVEACEKGLKKCGGVPLAIITIASLLANKPGEVWSEIYNSIGFGHEDNDDVTNTRRILSFSYYDLPSHLKACLLYLSLFPEDHLIEKNSLIWKWVAEGFISKEQAAAAGVGLFELGQRCFNELINRNMILPQETGYGGYVDACSVHDMVLDLILRLSSEENFVTVLNGGERQKFEGSISRRLALQCVQEHNGGQLANISMEKVRSIFSSSCDFCALCPRLPLLRVAEMEGCSVSKDCVKVVSLAHHLGSLLHLRYLRLQSITKLSGEVRYLRFLQTLDIWESSNIVELPEEVGLLTQLVCLRVHYSRTRVPSGLMSKLTSLQELRICCDCEDATMMKFVKELALLRELRVLQARILGNSESTVSDLLESLGHLHNIQELRIDVISKNMWVTSDAAEQWVVMHEIRFVSFIGGLAFSGLPAWIKSSLAPNLSCLRLDVVAVEEQDMETLAKLPELTTLILRSNSDTELVVSIKVRTGEDGAGYFFRKLRFLEIFPQSICFDLRDSECNSSSSSRAASSNNTIMPSLESLEFRAHVRSLKDESIRLQLGLDTLLGFHNLGTSSLQRVTVYVDCGGAGRRAVEEAEAALKHAAAVHPKHPTLQTKREWEKYMISRYHEVHTIPTGHRKKITGLAFSKAKMVLVSSGADAQLCVWSIGGWEKKKSRYIQPPSNHSGALVGDTMVQFHYDQTHLLVVHESQLAIYDWQLECLCSWFPRDPLPAPISSAVYSIGCVLVYAGFCDGAIGIFKAESLTLQCRIVPSAYIPSLISRSPLVSSGGETVYPTVVSTHPWKPNQIAVGMSDGAVLVLEPLDTDEKQVASDASLEVRTTSTH